LPGGNQWVNLRGGHLGESPWWEMVEEMKRRGSASGNRSVMCENPNLHLQKYDLPWEIWK